MKEKKLDNQKRYTTLPSYPGIRKENKTDRYIASKCVNKKRYYKSFTKLKDAITWKNNFHPSIINYENQVTERPQGKNVFNGVDNGLYFSDVWVLYQQQHLAALEPTTQRQRLQMADFYDGLLDFKMCEITPVLLDRYIEHSKKMAMAQKFSKRFSFDMDLKNLRAIFNWYQQNYDDLYINPVRSRHKVLGLIKKKEIKSKKLSKQQFIDFLSHLDGIWKDLVITQFLIAGRIQEAAGLTVEALNFEENYIEIRQVMVWDRTTKRFDYLKDRPKNGHERRCYMCPELKLILQKRVSSLSKDCKFLFQLEGRPLSYRQIQYNYEKALKASGLYPQFSGTHMMRYTMATMANYVSGGIGATKVVTGHLDEGMAKHYGSLSSLDDSRRIIAQVGDYLNLKQVFDVSKCEQIE